MNGAIAKRYAATATGVNGTMPGHTTLTKHLQQVYFRCYLRRVLYGRGNNEYTSFTQSRPSGALDRRHAAAYLFRFRRQRCNSLVGVSGKLRAVDRGRIGIDVDRHWCVIHGLADASIRTCLCERLELVR